MIIVLLVFVSGIGVGTLIGIYLTVMMLEDQAVQRRRAQDFFRDERK